MVHNDRRGLLYESFTNAAFADATGSPLSLAQTIVSVSSVGVLRGIHYAAPGVDRKLYVTCLSGVAHDVVVDLRVGSATFGEHAAVTLDTKDRRSVSIEPGLGHGFLALAPDTTLLYLSSVAYSPDIEFCIDALDPTLNIAWPRSAADGTPIGEFNRSDRDIEAVSLNRAIEDQLLPTVSETPRSG